MLEILKKLAKDRNSFIELGSGNKKGPIKKGKILDNKINFKQALSSENKHRIGVFLKDNIIRIDIDDIKGLDTYINKILPDTLTFKTERGYHLFFTVPSIKKYKKGNYLLYNQLLVEVIPAGEKMYAITPINDPNRSVYKNCDIQPIPPLWDTMKKVKNKDFEKRLPITEGNRDETLFKISCVMKDKFTVNELLTIGKYATKPAFSDEKIKEKFNSADKYVTESRLLHSFIDDKSGFLNIHKVAMNIINEYDIAVIMENKSSIVAMFNGNKWALFSELEVMDIIEDLLPTEYITPANKDKILKLITQNKSVRRRWDDFNKQRDLLYFKDCTYNMKSRQIEAHKASNMNTFIIPHNFNIVNQKKISLKSCTFYKHFLSKTNLEEDDINLLMEWVAYCLFPTAHLKTFVFLTGPTNTGKSITLNAINYLVGADNMSDVSLHDLNTRFSSSLLFNKLVNSDGDGSSKALRDISMIKKMTGNDRIMHEDKGKPAFWFYPFAKQIYSFNRLPLQLDEKTDAFYNRLRVIELNKKLSFKDEFVRHQLVPGLVELLPYLVYKVIPQILKRDGITNSVNSKQQVRYLFESSDPVQAFINLWFIKEPGAIVCKKKAYKLYEDSCFDWEIQPIKYTEFLNDLKSKGIISKRRLVKGSKVDVFVDYRIKEIYE